MPGISTAFHWEDVPRAARETRVAGFAICEAQAILAAAIAAVVAYIEGAALDVISPTPEALHVWAERPVAGGSAPPSCSAPMARMICGPKAGLVLVVAVLSLFKVRGVR